MGSFLFHHQLYCFVSTTGHFPLLMLSTLFPVTNNLLMLEQLIFVLQRFYNFIVAKASLQQQCQWFLVHYVSNNLFLVRSSLSLITTTVGF